MTLHSPHAYRRALAQLYALEPRGIRPGTSRIRAALAALGRPERRLRAVLVAGTNGKGSVCAMVERALRAEGLRTGLYTSPHLHRFSERIRVDGRPVAPATVVDAVRRLAPVLFDPARALTFFEATTIVAFDLLARARPDVAVIEVGLGGRLDATTVVRPVVCAVTSIGLDHTDKLGGTLARIAWEKAGVIRRAVPAVVGPLPRSAARVVERVARARRAPLIRVRALAEGTPRLALRGPHQRENAAVAVGVLEALCVGRRAIGEGLRRVRWPARLETLPGRPPIVLDVAHNAQGCAALRRSLEGVRRPVVVLGVLRDKRAGAMVRALGPLARRLVWCRPRSARAADPAALASRLGGEVVPDPVAALRRAREIAGPRGTVVVCGSIFVVGPVRAKLLGITEDPPIAL